MHRRLGLLVASVLTACATMANTPAQDLAWERWKACDRFPTITLKDIRPNGDIWVWATDGPDLGGWRACEREAQAAQRRAGKLSPSTQPAIAEADVRGLVKFAYFTDAPPTPGTFLHTTFGRNMPPEVTQFPPGRPVTFFYALHQVGRVLAIQGRWTDPEGRLVKSVDQTLEQMGRGGLWTWQVQTLPTEDLSRPGRWGVELLIGGYPVGRYEFVRLP